MGSFLLFGFRVVLSELSILKRVAAAKMTTDDE